MRTLGTELKRERVLSEVTSTDVVLLLDDDPAMLVFLEGILSSAGFRCLTETDPALALTRIAAQREITLVVSDVCMPQFSGLQFIDKLHALPLDWPPPRVLLLTAHPSLEGAIDALRLGAQDFLLKPITPPDLIHAIGRALARSRADRQAEATRPPEIKNLLQQAEELAQRLRQMAYSDDAQRYGPHGSRLNAETTEPRKALAEPAVSDLLEKGPVTSQTPLIVLDTIEHLRHLQEHYISHDLDKIEWDLLLELLRAERLHQRLSVSALTISTNGASTTTSLRRVNSLVSRGYIQRIPDASDARRDFVTLTSKSNELLSDYLARANEHLRNLVA